VPRGTLISLRVRQTLRPSGSPRRWDLTHFRARPGHTGITSRVPFHGRPTSFLVMLVIGSKEGITPSSALRNAASPTKGTALQRLLDSGVAPQYLLDWRSSVTFWSCGLQVAVCPLGPGRDARGPRGRLPDVRVRGAFAPPLPICNHLSSGQYMQAAPRPDSKSLEHQYVWLRHTTSHNNDGGSPRSIANLALYRDIPFTGVSR